ncbi:methyltransferase domain-containing protein [Actinomadura vinacea]|uniref:Methyltransferase domain-containing protein n=1 Tax=Actinomadura vinacea TaxID=115336 RepID=A0ABN3ITJ3_9ACTN
MLADVVEYLVCPVCGESLALETSALRCPAGHAFDIARQGYANLLLGNARPGTADTPEMVRARDAFLGAGHFAPVSDLLSERLSEGLGEEREPVVLDAGAGTGYYLRDVLDRSPDAVGLALDISKHAARRAARAHPRIGAIVTDLWRPLPLRSDVADAILNVFAPRNASEFHRVLKPEGTLYTVTPSERHLQSLVSTLGLLSVDEQKTERTEAALVGHFTLETCRVLDVDVTMSRSEAATLVGMGPSAHHIPAEELGKRLAELPDPLPVPLSFVLSAYRRLQP